MSLQVWLPLNGNLNNQGISNLTFSNISPTAVSSSGKIGSCYNNTSQNSGGVVSNTTVSLGSTQSMFCWINFTQLYSTSSLCGVLGQHRYYNNTGMGITIKYVSSTTGYLSINTGTGSSRTYNTYCGSTLLSAGTWYHVGFTYDGSTARLYVNGKLDGTHSVGTMSCPADYIFAFAWSLDGSSGSSLYTAYYKLNGSLNDIRMYDHCLSTKEVEELAKGLVLHYKLNDGYMEPTTNVDPLGNTTPNFTNMTSCTYGNYFGRNCYKVICSASSTGWVGSYSSFLPTNSGFAVGDVLTRSCDLYIPSGQTTTGWYGVPYAFETCDSVSKQCYDTSKYNTWQHCWSTATIRSTSSNFLYYWFAASNATCKIEFYITNMQCENKDHSTPYTPTSRDVGLCYDSSGYNYNLTGSGSVLMYQDSPRYDRSCDFNQTGYFYNNSINLYLKQYTAAMWIKIPSSITAQHFLFGTFTSWTGNGMGAWRDTGGNYYSWIMRSDSESSHGSLNPGSYSYDTWYHIAWVWDGTSIICYKNGEYYTSTTYGSSGTCYCPVMYIGNSQFGTRSTETDESSMSDFRFYATALSADQIKELYNTSASIDNQGNIHVRELIEN